jgi:hypothetical protein
LLAWVLAACGAESSTREPFSFPSPFGDPGSGVFCGEGTHLSGQECVPDTAFDAGPPAAHETEHDAGTLTDAGARADAAVSDAGPMIDVATACLGEANRFVITGYDWVHRGPPLVIEDGAGWLIDVYDWRDGLPSDLYIHAGNDWSVRLSSRGLGVGLGPGTYTGAQRAPFAESTHPGLDVSGDGRGCNQISGQFTIVDLQTSADDMAPESDAGEPADAGPGVGDDAGTSEHPALDGGMPQVTSITATFEQHCENGLNYNVGCIHVSVPVP